MSKTLVIFKSWNLLKNKRIIVFYNKTLIEITDLKIIKAYELASFQVKANNDWINFTTMYAPQNVDNSEFMLQSKTTLDSLEGDYGVLCGDFNTTLDPKNDCLGYTSDSHKRCRSTILSWIETDELIDTIICFNPDCQLYSWRTKKFDRRGRIDNLLVTPKLMPYISEARYVFHEHELTDHASLIFTLDIKNAEMGKGLFRAKPALLKHPN